MNTYLLTISTPDGNLLSEEVYGLFLRGADGDLAILANHVPFITTVKPGTCRVELADGTEKTGSVKSGILTVSKDGATLLSGSFNWD